MTAPFYTLIVSIAVAAVALADVALKRATVVADGPAVARHPWLWVGVALYLVQIALFAYLLERGVNLSYIGVLQTVVYALIVLGASFFLFGERVTSLQAVGMTLAV